MLETITVLIVYTCSIYMYVHVYIKLCIFLFNRERWINESDWRIRNKSVRTWTKSMYCEWDTIGAVKVVVEVSFIKCTCTINFSLFWENNTSISFKVMSISVHNTHIYMYMHLHTMCVLHVQCTCTRIIARNHFNEFICNGLYIE